MQSEKSSISKPLKRLNKRPSKRWVVGSAIGLTLIWGGIKTIPMFLDSSDIKKSIEKGLHDAAGINVHIKRMQLEPTLVSNLKVHLDTNTITDEHNHPLGDIRHITIQIRYLPLLTALTPEIASIDVDNVHIPIRDYSLFKSLKIKPVPPDNASFLKPVKLKDTRIRLTDFHIVDYRPNKTARAILSQAQGLDHPLANSIPLMLFNLDSRELILDHLESGKNITIRGNAGLGFAKALLPVKSENSNTNAEDAEIWQGDSQFEAELAAVALQEGHAISSSDLRRLKLSLLGKAPEHAIFPDQKVFFNTKKHSDQTAQKSGPKNVLAKPVTGIDMKLDYHIAGKGFLGLTPNLDAAEGKLDSRKSSLAHGQAILLQLANIVSVAAPDVARQTQLSGAITSNAEFKLALNEPKHPIKQLSGSITLDDVAVASNAKTGIPPIQGIKGKLNFNKQQAITSSINFECAGLPLKLTGFYDIASNHMDLRLNGDSLNLTSIRNASKQLEMKQSGLEKNPLPQDLEGVLNAEARAWGSLTKPFYEGKIALKKGGFDDPKLGVSIHGISAFVTGKGQGFGKAAKLDYYGNIAARQGSLYGPYVSPRKGNLREWAIPSVEGQAKFLGQWRGSQTTFTAPKAFGTLRFKDGYALIPQSTLQAQKIQGMIQLNGEQVHLRETQTLLAGETIHAQANTDTSASRYDGKIWSTGMDLPRLYKTLLTKLPDIQIPDNSFRLEHGTANLNVTVAGSGLKAKPTVKGKIDVNHLAMLLPRVRRAVTNPALTLDFNTNQAILNPTNFTYAPASNAFPSQMVEPVIVTLNGTYGINSGQYNASVHSADITMGMLRDLHDLAALSGIDGVPEVWNTAGSFDLSTTISNQNTTVHTTFHDAGLSWKDADFPLYGLNGAIFITQQGQQQTPSISTQNLRFVYGRSPIVVEAHNEQDFRFMVRGLLSELTVNHYLVSPQSNATPYHDMPFTMEAKGHRLHIAPGGTDTNDVTLVSHLDLGEALAEATHDIDKPPESELPDKESTGEKPLTQNVKKTPKKTPQDSVMSELQKQRDRSYRPPVVQRINPINLANTAAGLVMKTTAGAKSGLDTLVDILTPAWLEEDFDEDEDDAKTKKAENENKKEKEAQKINASENKATQSNPNPSKKNKSDDPIAQLAKLQENGDGEISQEANTEPQEPRIELNNPRHAFVNSTIHWTHGNVELQDFVLRLFTAGEVKATGNLYQVLNPNLLHHQFHIWTEEPVNLAKLGEATDEDGLFKNAKGTAGGDVQINQASPALSPQITGQVTADDVAIPLLTLRNLSAVVDFLGQGADVRIGPLDVPGIEVHEAGAHIDSLFEVPMTLDQVYVRGKQLDMAGIANFNNRIFKPILVDRIAHNYMRPWQLGDPILPIQFRGGQLSSEELIYQNILMSNLKSNLSVYATGFCELNNTDVEAAGGKAGGYLSMNANDNNFTTLDLTVDQVKANALTKALLNVTNQIFGDLQGNIRFTTFGATDADMQKNANGTVSMKVTNGRLPAIARVETLLTTANLFRGGVLGLNLNNIFRTLTFYDTNYFAEMGGDMVIANQVLYTRNLISDGVNLDLKIRGSMKMDDGAANMVVNGTMSQDVVGKLGFLGNLSLGKLLKLIPLLGTAGKSQAGLFGYLPGVGFVPGFGGPAAAQNQFQVRLKGSLDSPGAIQDFHWVRRPLPFYRPPETSKR